MILPAVRDPRLVTIRRGGSLTDADHRLLALWAAACASRVLPLFVAAAPADPRPAEALDAVQRWVDGALPTMATRAAGGHAMAAARPLQDALCRLYDLTRVVSNQRRRAHAVACRSRVRLQLLARAGRAECGWQRAQVPPHLHDFVREDQARRNDICWNVFVD